MLSLVSPMFSGPALRFTLLWRQAYFDQASARRTSENLLQLRFERDQADMARGPIGVDGSRLDRHWNLIAALEFGHAGWAIFAANKPRLGLGNSGLHDHSPTMKSTVLLGRLAWIRLNQLRGAAWRLPMRRRVAQVSCHRC